jgi:hypothetical protein
MMYQGIEIYNAQRPGEAFAMFRQALALADSASPTAFSRQKQQELRRWLSHYVDLARDSCADSVRRGAAPRLCPP